MLQPQDENPSRGIFCRLIVASVLAMQDDNRRNTIGSQVKNLRKIRGLTQDDLIARCDLLGFELAQNTLAKIETGTRGVSDLEMILFSKALRVDLNELVPAKLPAWKKDLRPPSARSKVEN